MKRDTVVNVLLIIAGIVLAIALFGAGAFWKSKSSSTKTVPLTWTPIETRGATECDEQRAGKSPIICRSRPWAAALAKGGMYRERL